MDRLVQGGPCAGPLLEWYMSLLVLMCFGWHSEPCLYVTFTRMGGHGCLLKLKKGKNAQAAIL